jgi:hypothetical protein
MKAEDLMLGDWVHYKVDLGKDGIYEKYIQITNIYGCDVNCELREYEIISGLRMDNLYPIPLTLEILEKNGFKKEGNQFVIENDYYDVSIREITDSIWRIKYCNTEFSVFDCVLHIASVHELQHALKFCGIDKEIVI